MPIPVIEADLEDLKDDLAGIYEKYARDCLPYSNTYAALVRLQMPQLAGPFSTYPSLSTMYSGIAERIRGAATLEGLRACMLEIAEATRQPPPQEEEGVSGI